MHVPLLIPCRPLCHLHAAENLHHVGNAEGNETLLPPTLRIRPVEAIAADRVLVEQDQGGSECLAACACVQA